MRLTPTEIDAIKAAASEVFGVDAVVRLFGSRVHDHLLGGDIDLLIEVESARRRERDVDRFRTRLFDRIDEQKVDVVLFPRKEDPDTFARFVAPQSVPLS
ncbi:MAG TPA: nucleotidyltransferase domain-containing protein [Sphingomonas sp.]|uniref:nucleotidyltransferase domain-containing protein n=1 Tax=Sphingomonas sp. TaxID=28214 RepID=UPI002ED82170